MKGRAGKGKDMTEPQASKAAVGRVFRVGKQTINAKVTSYYMVESPENGPDCQYLHRVCVIRHRPQV